MTILPGPKPTAPAAGQATPTDADRAQAARWLAALDEITGEKPTAVRVDDPTIPSWKDGTRIGNTPPVPQPGIPPQSRAAVDYAVRVLSTSVASVLFGGSASLVMVASGYANPTVIAWVCVGAVALPPAVAFPVLALKGLMKSAKEVVQAAPPDVRNYYNGPVYQDQRNVHSRTSGVWVKNTNQQ